MQKVDLSKQIKGKARTLFYMERYTKVPVKFIMT